jgi:hypothetical protein
MPLWLKKLVLAAALAVMPLQGIAGGLSALLCHGDAQAHAAHAGDSHDHSAPHDSHHDKHSGDNGGAGGSAYHLCCHYTVSAPSAVTLPVALPDFPVRAYAPDPLHDLFVPDRPQRPPLA